MGFLRKVSRSMGHADGHLLAQGLLARGHVVECRRTAMTTGRQVERVVCELTVEVQLEDQPVYTAHCKHAIQIPYLPQFESGQASVAVRVDPEDPQNIELDLTTDVPPPRDGAAAAAAAAEPAAAVQLVDDTGAPLPPELARAAQEAMAHPDDPMAGNRVSPVTGAEILATGTPCRLVVQSAQPMGMQKDGRDVWALILNVTGDGAAPRQVRIGVGVPAAATGLLFPGANLPGRQRADVPDGATPDWDAALAERP
jgi:hypothetical protein